MDTLKQEAIKMISKLPETAEVDDIMYELYVIDKINKGRKAAKNSASIAAEDLKEEIKTW